MFEFRACQLKKGDVFTIDNGETWLTVSGPLTFEGRNVVVLVGNTACRLPANSLVIVR